MEDQTPITNQTIESKHEAMITRLANLHQSRLLSKGNNPDSHSSSIESTKLYLTKFAESKTTIESNLNSCRQNQLMKNELLKCELDNVSKLITELEKYVAESSYFLPSYELRASLKCVSDLKEMLDVANSELLPKKKFAFKNKGVFKRVGNNVGSGNVEKEKSAGFGNKDGVLFCKDIGGGETNVGVEGSVGGEKRLVGEVREESDLGFKDKEEALLVKDFGGGGDNVDVGGSNNVGVVEKKRVVGKFREELSPGFRSKEGVVLVKHFGGESKEQGRGEGDFTLSDLRNCEVRLTGRCRAIYINKLKDCRVYVGPVLGSILIEETEGCMFVLASHQIRIHYAKETDFYLRVRSRPIVEDCNDVRFAPYVLKYDGIEKDLRESKLDEETGNWGKVDDFKWLRAVQSPNWSILPVEERVGTVKISSDEDPSMDC